MRALVTGSAGYIGQILCQYLYDEGWEVVGVDINNKINESNSEHLYDYNCEDIEDGGYGNLPYSWLKSQNPDVIFHLGAHSLLGPSVKQPLDYFHNNNSNMINFINRIRFECPDTPIIFASSAAVYGDIEEYPLLSEEHAGKPINPYGWSKWFGEKILLTSCQAYGIKAYAMRFFNVAGAYKDFGQNVDQPHILTSMSKAAIQGKSFVINGGNYDTPDGTCIRDYVHVVDVCSVLIKAAENALLDVPGTFKTYNVGNGNGNAFSNLELAKTFNHMYGMKFAIGKERPGDPARLLANPIKTRVDLTHRKTSSIESIITSHFEHIRKQLINE